MHYKSFCFLFCVNSYWILAAERKDHLSLPRQNSPNQASVVTSVVAEGLASAAATLGSQSKGKVVTAAANEHRSAYFKTEGQVNAKW